MKEGKKSHAGCPNLYLRLMGWLIVPIALFGCKLESSAEIVNQGMGTDVVFTLTSDKWSQWLAENKKEYPIPLWRISESGDVIEEFGILSDDGRGADMAKLDGTYSVGFTFDESLSRVLRFRAGYDAANPKTWSNSLTLKIQPPEVDVNYFSQIAFGEEFGDAEDVIQKWRQNLRIQYFGAPTAIDLTQLDLVISELNELIGHSIKLEIVNENPNVTIYFVPVSQFRKYEKNYVANNLGFFWEEVDSEGIYAVNILISTTRVTQLQRSHLLREELTQSLGLMRDSYDYPQSIFYQGWTATTEFTDLDRNLISILYREDITHGMTRDEAFSQLGVAD